ncbi:hypothetical protein Z5883 [Escherichia coli O157:H7 str. EDL933]|uniref:Uncharacterized protein n=1 Tax=Escherichia coli O157:H7 TaxID=83334 RepID=Q8X4F5_ECO57|nr:hypothetical protein Z5883 [Escherichia coli O157:H7 str. EDL933]
MQPDKLGAKKWMS